MKRTFYILIILLLTSITVQAQNDWQTTTEICNGEKYTIQVNEHFHVVTTTEWCTVAAGMARDFHENCVQFP